MVIHTNGGKVETSKECMIPKFGIGWFNQDTMMNILGLADMVNKSQVTFDLAKEDAFFVYLQREGEILTK